MPDQFIPALVELHLQGKFPFDKLISFYALSDIIRQSLTLKVAT